MPRVEGIPPGSWWRALISVICCTSIRVGQATACPMDAIDWKNRTLTLPPECSRKSLREECHPLHPVAIRDLLVIRGDREKLFPQPHAKTALYKQLYRLQTKAEIPEERQFAFHCLRRTAITLIAKQSSAAAQMAAGHASFKTTVNHYLCQDVLSEAVDKMDFLDQLEKPS
jgi:integrase